MVGGFAGGDGRSGDGGPDAGDPTDTASTPRSCEEAGPDARVPSPIEPDVRTFQDFRVVRHVPAQPRGLLPCFHRGSEVGEGPGTEHVAQVWNPRAAKNGLAVVATRRTQSPEEPWVNAPHGDDARRLDALRDEPVATTALEEPTPHVLGGFSDGGPKASGFMGLASWSFHRPVVAATPPDGVFGDLPVVPTQPHVGEHRLEEAGADAAIESTLAREKVP